MNSLYAPMASVKSQFFRGDGTLPIDLGSHMISWSPIAPPKLMVRATTVAIETMQSSERGGKSEREAFLKKGIQLSTKQPQRE